MSKTYKRINKTKDKTPVDFWSRRNFGNMCVGFGKIAKMKQSAKSVKEIDK